MLGMRMPKVNFGLAMRSVLTLECGSCPGSGIREATELIVAPGGFET